MLHRMCISRRDGNFIAEKRYDRLKVRFDLENLPLVK